MMLHINRTSDEYLYILQEEFRDYCASIIGEYWSGIEIADKAFEDWEASISNATILNYI